MKRTPLFQVHQAAGARLIEFAGYEMPVQYSGVLEEHRTVRLKAGIFDLSHMGEFLFTGPEALGALQRLLTNDLSKLEVGGAQYSLLCLENGGIVDDVIVFRLAQGYLMVVNAANIAKDLDWIKAHLPEGVHLEDQSEDTALIAVQGPEAARIVQALTSLALDGLYSFEAAEDQVAGKKALIARTGYTGEDGFEIYLGAADAVAVWEALMAVGQPLGLVPVGLGARDTLRLEAGLTLYGHEIDERTTPLEAGLGYFVRFEKGDFLGKEALLKQKAEGVKQKLVAFTVEGRGIPRQGYPLLAPDGSVIGRVTSGSFSPTLERDIGMGYVQTAFAAPGTLIGVDIRGKARPAEVIKGRFVPSRTRRRP